MLSINDHPDIRALFRHLACREVEYEYTVGGGNQGKHCLELIYGNWADVCSATARPVLKLWTYKSTEEGRGLMQFFPEADLHAMDQVVHELSRQEKFGNSGNWFLHWRIAINGVRARSASANDAFIRLTEWLPSFPLYNPESEVAVCLFGMDSGLECWTYALNAIGFAILPEGGQFFDISNHKNLRAIGPKNVIGPRAEHKKAGYDTIFPRLAQLWRSAAGDIELVMDNHDVSKHRYSCFSGGTMRNDPPLGLLESVGLPSIQQLGPFRTPMSDILLPRRPRVPLHERSSDLGDWLNLVDLKKRFDLLLQQTPIAAREDLANYVS